MEIKDWNPTKDDLLKVERLINGHQLEYDDLVRQKKDKEYDLSAIKNSIRIGKYKDDAVYEGLCRNQNVLIAEVAALQKPINEVKKKLREKHLMKEEIRNHLFGDVKISDELELKIIELRDYYTNFAGDATRVSSTRIMASKFAEDMQFLIKIIKQ